MNQEYEKSPHLIYKVICTDVPQEVAEACEAQMDLPLAERQLMSNAKPVEGYITACTSEPAEDGLYFLETNTIPGMTSASLVPKMVCQAGLSMTEFLSVIVENS